MENIHGMKLLRGSTRAQRAQMQQKRPRSTVHREGYRRFVWRPSYSKLVRKYIRQHFGNVQGITDLFPYMKTDFKIKDGSADVLDPRTVLKSNNEYHGLERHARQYHVVGMYDEAAAHWLIAAAWRFDVIKANGTSDERHLKAAEFALRNYSYNQALHRWQKKLRRSCPAPKHFGLDAKMMDIKDANAEAEVNSAYARRGSKPPFDVR